MFMIHPTDIRSARPGDAAQLAKIYVDTWRSAYASLLPRNYLDHMSYSQVGQAMQRALSDPRLCFLVAEGQNQAIGYISGGAERSRDPIYAAEIYELYMLPEFQHQGAGNRLLAALARILREREFYSLKVWVLSGNPSRRFYERNGGIFLGTKSILFAGRRLKVAAYGWIDITLAGQDPV